VAYKRASPLKRAEEAGGLLDRSGAVGGVINTDSGGNAAETQRLESRCHPRSGLSWHLRCVCVGFCHTFGVEGLLWGGPGGRARGLAWPPSPSCHAFGVERRGRAWGGGAVRVNGDFDAGGDVDGD
jgi:hypothetical protein